MAHANVAAASRAHEPSSLAACPPLVDLEFPGCRRLRISTSEMELFDGRIEFWDAGAETAWQVASPAADAHERPNQQLVRLIERIAALRGAPIKCSGAVDIVVGNEDGTQPRIMQADQAIFLDPARAPAFRGSVDVGTDALPDVAFEVDATTDARSGKLELYRAWGFPEVWVEVPKGKPPSVSRRPSGLTIYRLDGGAYLRADRSAAFPRWTAAQIHRAINEKDQSEATAEDLLRVSSTLAKRLSTPGGIGCLFGEQRRESCCAGNVKGWHQSLELVEILTSRDITPTKELARRFDTIARMPVPVLIRAAFHCLDAQDLVGRIDDWASAHSAGATGTRAPGVTATGAAA